MRRSLSGRHELENTTASVPYSSAKFGFPVWFPSLVSASTSGTVIPNEAPSTRDLEQGHLPEPPAPSIAGPLPGKPAPVSSGEPGIPALGLSRLAGEPGGAGIGLLR